MALNSREAGTSVKDLIKKYNTLGDKNTPKNNPNNNSHSSNKPKNANNPNNLTKSKISESKSKISQSKSKASKANLVETKHNKANTSTKSAHGTLPQPPAKTYDVNLTGLLSAPLTRLIGAYLDDITHIEFAKGLFFSAGACDDDVAKRKQARAVRVKHELLPYVFNGQPDSVYAFLEQDGITPLMILTATDFDEGYFSNELQEFVRFRFWPSVTPLQAAACTGDRILLQDDLFLHMGNDVSIKKEVILQLEEVQQGISDQKLLLEAIDALLKIKFGENDSIEKDARKRLEEIKRTQEFQKQMEAFRCEMEDLRMEVMTRKRNKGKNPIKLQNAGTIGDQKLNSDRNGAIGERKKTEEGTITTKFTGDTEFLSGVIMLLRAYVNHWIQGLTDNKDMDEYQYSWDIVGECHKRLYVYIKQLFNDYKRFLVDTDTDSAFMCSPERGHNVHIFPLDLDSLGFGTGLGFYKGSAGLHLGNSSEGVAYGFTECFAADAAVMANLYKNCVTALDKTIKHLKKFVPENTITIGDGCSKSRKPS